MWLSTGLVGITLILMFLTLPETLYLRDTDPGEPQSGNSTNSDKEMNGAVADHLEKEPRPTSRITVKGRLPNIATIATSFPKRRLTGEPVWKLPHTMYHPHSPPSGSLGFIGLVYPRRLPGCRQYQHGRRIRTDVPLLPVADGAL